MKCPASDVTDKEWAMLEPLIPAAKPGGRPQEIARRESSMAYCMCCAVGVHGVCCRMICPTGVRSTYISASGNGLGSGNRSTPPCDGRCASALGAIPNRVRPFSTVNRSRSSSVRGDERGYDGGKKIQGRKRQLLMDTQGLLITVKVLTADLGDRAGGKVLLLPLVGKMPRLQVIWADSGYAGSPFQHWVKEYLGVRLEIVNHPWSGLRGVWAPEGAKIDWDKIMPKGFHVLPKRWVVERTNAWITHCRRLCRDFEGTHSSSESFIYLAMSKLMMARLARAGP